MDASRAHAGPRVGDLLDGRYRLEGYLGAGGMAVVFRASDESLGRTVAVKVFLPGAGDERDAVRRTSETRLLASLSHPALVTLFDAHLGAGDPAFLVMEYIEGGTLDSRLLRGPLDQGEAAQLAADLGEALHTVHGAGIIHRDIKPSNILLRPPLTPLQSFRPALADFGIAYLVDTTRVTTPGTAVGTAAFISPEQARGGDPLPASDIYAFGLVLIEALTGRRAFDQPTPVEVIAAKLSMQPAVPREFGDEWRTLLTAMTARDAGERPTAWEVALRGRELGGGGATAPMAPPSLGVVTSALPAEPRGATVSQPTLTVPLEERGDGGSRAEQEDAEETPPRNRRRGLVIAGVTAAVGAAALAAVLGAVATTQPPPAGPELPLVGEPLDTHLRDLLDEVTW